jgi:hypothetical protein
MDEELVNRARELTGVTETTALVRAGLEALIAREAARRLALLGASEPNLKIPPRQRAWTAK